MTQHPSLAAMHALVTRSREIESDEREAASALVLGTCAGHGLAYCGDCVGPLVAGQGFAMHCGGRGQAAIRCESVEAFAEAQRRPYTHGNDSERTTRTRS